MEAAILPARADVHITSKPSPQTLDDEPRLELWWSGDVPTDRRRVGLFVSDSIRLAGLSVEEFSALLHSTRATELAEFQSIGVQQAVMILLIEHRFESLVANARQKKRFIVVTGEMRDLAPACADVPDDLLVVFDG